MSPTAFLLNPPGLPGTTANRDGSAGMGVSDDRPGGFVYPSHLLASVAAVLRVAHWRVKGLDAVALGQDTESVLGRLPDADLLIVPVSYGTLASDRAFLNLLRERKPLLKVLAIGPALSYPQVDHGLNDLVDLLITGEPDLAVPAAAKRLLAGAFTPGEAVSPYALAQTAYTPDGRLADLDALPLPAWDLYHGMAHSYPFLTILSSRGCPAGCAFCPYVAAQGTRHRFQSPARTVEEFSYLVERFQPPRIMFRDPVFAYERNRVLALCSELRRLQHVVPWECESRPEHFDHRLLRALRDAGCDTIKIGLESADPEVLVGIGRVNDEPSATAYLEQVAAVIAACRQVGLVCRLFVMVGLPYQTGEALGRTADFLRRNRPQRLHVKPFQWYPGIALSQSFAPDAAEQAAFLRAAIEERPALWRRVARKLPR